MLRAILLILLMGAGSWGYQTWLAEQVNYIETLQMLYWSTITAVVFWANGLFGRQDS